MREKFRFKELQYFLLFFGLLALIVFVLQRNVVYRAAKRVIEPYAVEAMAQTGASQHPECLILWEEDEMGLLGRNMMEQILGQMKIPYVSAEGKEGELYKFGEYQTVVLSMTHWNLLDEKILELAKWVEEGGKLMVLYPPTTNGAFQLLADELGIQSTGSSMKYVEEVTFEDTFMLDGGRGRLKLPDPYESSLQVNLYPECRVQLWTGEEDRVPLVWTYDNHSGRVIFCNLGHLDKRYRGFYSAGYSLMGDYCVWPVINGSAFYLDDFPAPVADGENEYIRRDYEMGIADFHKQIWWNDLCNLAKKYGIRYTGLAIEEYSNEVEAPFERLQNTRDYRYYGSMMLKQGGEIGLHGYNHMPLCLTYQGRRDPSFKNWRSREDMVKGIEELETFLGLVFPEERFRVYGPPANILSQEGREMLSAEFPEISAIAGVYIDGEMTYDQEFEVAQDGIIETPRVISGYVFDDSVRLAAVSELNFHYVSSHFQHFHDVLEKDSGGELGWKELLGELSGYADWLYHAAPDIRNLTGIELAGAVQRYDNIVVSSELIQGELRLTLGNFVDEAWLMIRLNTAAPKEVRGGSIQQLSQNLYLLKADAGQVVIELR